jgi:hypothetical protein
MLEVSVKSCFGYERVYQCDASPKWLVRRNHSGLGTSGFCGVVQLRVARGNQTGLCLSSSKKRLKRNRIGALVNQLHSDGLYVRGNQNARDSKDPKDNFLIAITEQGQANALVSSDNIGVLELGILGEAVILKPAEFLNFLRLRQLID